MIAKFESDEVLYGIDWADPDSEPSVQKTRITMTIKTGWKARLRAAFNILFRPRLYAPAIEFEVKLEYKPPAVPDIDCNACSEPERYDDHLCMGGFGT